MPSKNDTPLLVLTVAITFAFFVILRVLGDRTGSGETNLVPMTMIALITGTFVEYWRVVGSGKRVLQTTSVALLLSLFAFQRGKSELSISFPSTCNYGHSSFWEYML